MSIRWKFALALALTAGLTAALLGAASYRSTRDRLFDEVDQSLLTVDVRRLGADNIPERAGLGTFAAQIVASDGTVLRSTFADPIPAPDLSGLDQRGRFETVSTDDGDYRVRTVGGPRGAVQIARPLDETERVLASLRIRTLVIGGVAASVAALIGLFVAAQMTAALRRLTRAAEHVGATGQLDVAVGESGADEVGRLGSAFDAMLATLARSKADQRRLVQDAGHELRTPLTSVRTNIDVLRRYPDLPGDERQVITDDLDAETRELSALVEEVVGLASGERDDEPAVEVDLGELVEGVAARYRRRTGREIVVAGDSSKVVGRASMLDRAVSSLIDNAAKFDPSGSKIDVSVDRGVVTVMDRGPGIDAADQELVFNRFSRADSARSLPGSGLGLSIVREVAVSHGGSAFASDRPGGGAQVGFRIPPLTASAQP